MIKISHLACFFGKLNEKNKDEILACVSHMTILGEKRSSKKSIFYFVLTYI